MLLFVLVIVFVAAELFTNALEIVGERTGVSEGVTGSIFAAVGHTCRWLFPGAESIRGHGRDPGSAVHAGNAESRHDGQDVKPDQA